MSKTISLITGSNQGIGFATATRLAKEHNYHVIIASRKIENGCKAANQLKSEGLSADAVQLDIRSDESIAAAAAYLTETYGYLDVLINNAGVLLDGEFGGNMHIRELYDITFSTNVVGTACLTEALLPLLYKSTQRPRLIFVSSRMGSLTESLNPNTKFYDFDCRAYDASKAAINMLTVNYSRILADKKAYVNSVCPGLVTTNLSDLSNLMPGAQPPDIGAQRIVELATLTGKDTDVTGTFSARTGMIPW